MTTPVSKASAQTPTEGTSDNQSIQRQNAAKSVNPTTPEMTSGEKTESVATKTQYLPLSEETKAILGRKGNGDSDDFQLSRGSDRATHRARRLREKEARQKIAVDPERTSALTLASTHEKRAASRVESWQHRTNQLDCNPPTLGTIGSNKSANIDSMNISEVEKKFLKSRRDKLSEAMYILIAGKDLCLSHREIEANLKNKSKEISSQDNFPTTIAEVLKLYDTLAERGIKPKPVAAVVAHSGEPNGANFFLLSVVSAMLERGDMLPKVYAGADGDFNQHYRDLGVDVEVINPREGKVTLQNMQRAIAGSTAGLVNCTMSTAFTPVFETMGKPTIAVIHESLPVDGEQLKQFISKTFKRDDIEPGKVTRSMEFVTRLVLVSQMEYHKVVSLMLPPHEVGHVSCIRNGVPTEEIDALQTPGSKTYLSQSEAQRRLGFTGKVTMMAQTGTVYARKAPKAFALAFINIRNAWDLRPAGSNAYDFDKPVAVMAGARFANFDEATHVKEVLAMYADAGFKVNIGEPTTYGLNADGKFTANPASTDKTTEQTRDKSKDIDVPKLLLTSDDAFEHGSYDVVVLPQVKQGVCRLINRATDIGCSASNSEVLSLDYLEKMVARKPLVVSNAGGTEEAVKDRETGIIIGKGDAKGLEEGVLQLMRDPTLRKDMGDAARRKLDAEFSVTKMQDAYLNLFNDMEQSINIEQLRRWMNSCDAIDMKNKRNEVSHELVMQAKSTEEISTLLDRAPSIAYTSSSMQKMKFPS